MSLRTLSAVMACALLACAVAHPAAAQDKKLSPQQQKMKGCAAEWKEEKAAKKVSGRAEYNKFMSACLKKK